MYRLTVYLHLVTTVHSNRCPKKLYPHSFLRTEQNMNPTTNLVVIRCGVAARCEL